VVVSPAALQPMTRGGDTRQQTYRLLGVVVEAIYKLTLKAKPSPYAKRWWTRNPTQLRSTYTYWSNRARAETRVDVVTP
jgi:hypothetical protein